MNSPKRPWWRRWFWRLLKLFGVLVALIILLVIAGYFTLKSPRAKSWILTTIVHFVASQPLKEPPVATDDPLMASLMRLDRRMPERAGPDEFYSVTRVWDVHFRFNSNQWADLGPRRIESAPMLLQDDHRPVVRNAAAGRPGVAGVLGFDQPWSTAGVDIAGVEQTEVPIRFKGNGTFLDSMGTYRRPFKVSPGRSDPPRRIIRVREINLSNMSGDPSGVREAMAYELHRQAGVPAPRTAYCRLRLSVDGRFENGLLGLYLLVENPDQEWLEREVRVPGGVLFKPVTYHLFEDLGEDWSAYDKIYDARGDVPADVQRRVIEFCRLVSGAAEDVFAQSLGEYLDLGAFATFMACQALLSSHDGILATGQNFLVYLDPRDRLLRFIPWDMDRAFGNTPFIGSESDREEASLSHPWVGTNRFLERVFAVPAFREVYQAELKRLAGDLFERSRLERRALELAHRVRPFIAEESIERLAKFEQSLMEPGTGVTTPAFGGDPVLNLRQFIVARCRSVQEQLEGRSQGTIPEMRRLF